MKTRNFLMTLLLALSPFSHASGPPDGAMVADWNARMLAAAQAEDGFFTLKGVRAAAMMHLAMHDALNSIHRRYEPYAFEADGQGADARVAANQAAFAIAIDQYPGQRESWERLRRRWNDHWNGNGHARGRARGEVLGEAAARAILLKRLDDGWNSPGSYEFQPAAPGVYAEFPEHSGTPPGFVFGAGWPLARPFALCSAAQFRAAPPPAIPGAEYAQAFNEVKEAGRFDSHTRTADQTHLAMWWKDFAENSHNRLARQIVNDERTDLWKATRLFAWINMSLFDTYASVFESKFFHNHWRPYTAIRAAEQDGNPATQADPGWNNTHRHTYAFPSYPSAHGAACAAAMSAFSATYGDRYTFTMITPEVDASGPGSGKVAMQPPTRSFNRFSQAALECALSRVYLGIHFRYDSLAGNRQGRQVGEYITGHFLQPRRR